MSVSLKINEIDDSNHKNEIIGENRFKLDANIAAEAKKTAEQLNLINDKTEEKAEDKTEIKQEGNEDKQEKKEDTSLKDDLKNITSKLLKKHLLPTLKKALKKMNEDDE